MLPIKWTDEAKRDLYALIAFIAEENPYAAESLLQQLQESILPVAEHPYMFRAGRVPGTGKLWPIPIISSFTRSLMMPFWCWACFIRVVSIRSALSLPLAFVCLNIKGGTIIPHWTRTVTIGTVNAL